MAFVRSLSRASIVAAVTLQVRSVDVGEDRNRALIEDRRQRPHVGDRRGDDLVARLRVDRRDRAVHGRRARRAGIRVLDAERARRIPFSNVLTNRPLVLVSVPVLMTSVSASISLLAEGSTRCVLIGRQLQDSFCRSCSTLASMTPRYWTVASAGRVSTRIPDDDVDDARARVAACRMDSCCFAAWSTQESGARALVEQRREPAGSGSDEPCDAALDRFRPLGVLAQDDERPAEGRSLFLHAAGVRHDQPGARQQTVRIPGSPAARSDGYARMLGRARRRRLDDDRIGMHREDERAAWRPRFRLSWISPACRFWR